MTTKTAPTVDSPTFAKVTWAKGWECCILTYVDMDGYKQLSLRLGGKSIGFMSVGIALSKWQ